MKIIGLLMAVFLLIAMPCLAQTSDQGVSAPNDDNSHYSWADVLRVDPVYNVPEQRTPKQECWEEQVPSNGSSDSSVPVDRDSQRGVASVVGAIIGGLIGNRIGHGSGRAAATAVGAVAGGVVGNNIAAANERDDNNSDIDSDHPRHYTVQRHCRPVDPPVQRHIVAYDVEYRYRGDIYTTRLAHDPGDRLRVRVTVTPIE